MDKRSYRRLIGAVLMGVVLDAPHPAFAQITSTNGVVAGLPQAATPANGTATSITQTTATLVGTGDPNGFVTTGRFKWGLTPSYGNTTTSQSLGSGTTPVSVGGGGITGLSCGTTYYFTVEVTGPGGTFEDPTPASFVTSSCAVPPSAPTVVTGVASSVTDSTAILNGTANPNSATTTGHFEWGTTVSYTGTPTPDVSLGAGSSAVAITSGSLSNLACGTLYHFRATATNAGGTNTGSDATFTTAGCPNPGSLIVATQADFTYRGRFKMPVNLSPTTSSIYAEGMDVVYEGGTPHLIVDAYHPVEISIPTPTISPTAAPTATKLKDYGATPTSLYKDQNGASFNGTAYGLCYDQTASKLYTLYGANYNTGTGGAPGNYSNNPSILQFTRDYAAATLTNSGGPWGIANVQVKPVQSGCMTIPNYWSSVNLPGKSMIFGMGGYFSINGSGGMSFGPAFFATADPTGQASMAELANTELSYFINSASNRFPQGTTTPPFVNQFDSNPVTDWSWNPVNGCVWTYTTTHHGIVCTAEIGAGYGGYNGSNLRFQEGETRWFVIDPDILGVTPSNQIVYSSYWDVAYSEVNYSTFPVGPATQKSISSLTTAGSTATATSTAHGFATNDIVVIVGATQTAYNGIKAVTRIDADHFTFAVSGSPTSPATGTITAQKAIDSYAPKFQSFPPRLIAYDPNTHMIYVGVPSSALNTMVVYVWELAN
jgi:hypothetical protein